MKIAIYGAGWLGNPLAKTLAKDSHEIVASRSKPPFYTDYPNLTYLPWRAELGKPLPYWQPLIDAEIQIWSIPPRVKLLGESFYTAIIAEWLELLKQTSVKKIVFLSSTSVYLPSSDEEVTETGSIDKNSTIYHAEQLIENAGIPYLIIRFGGLMGGERFVGKYFTGKVVDRANGPVNYIHLEDAVTFTGDAILKDLSGYYNLVAPEHPTRKEVIIASCQQHQLAMPTEFIENETTPKIVSSRKIVDALGIPFKHPNPINF